MDAPPSPSAENKVPVVVFDAHAFEVGNLERVVRGEDLGTTIRSEALEQDTLLRAPASAWTRRSTTPGHAPGHPDVPRLLGAGGHVRVDYYGTPRRCPDPRCVPEARVSVKPFDDGVKEIEKASRSGPGSPRERRQGRAPTCRRSLRPAEEVRGQGQGALRGGARGPAQPAAGREQGERRPQGRRGHRGRPQAQGQIQDCSRSSRRSATQETKRPRSGERPGSPARGAPQGLAPAPPNPDFRPFEWARSWSVEQLALTSRSRFEPWRATTHSVKAPAFAERHPLVSGSGSPVR